ncbi:MAG: hypothetical protein ACRBN8_25390 [Nannocystales bacterium]
MQVFAGVAAGDDVTVVALRLAAAREIGAAVLNLDARRIALTGLGLVELGVATLLAGASEFVCLADRRAVVLRGLRL